MQLNKTTFFPEKLSDNISFIALKYNLYFCIIYINYESSTCLFKLANQSKV